MAIFHARIDLLTLVPRQPFDLLEEEEEKDCADEAARCEKEERARAAHAIKHRVGRE